MRSLAIGDIHHYASPYLNGIRDGLARLGIPHWEIDIRRPASAIARDIEETKPAIIWTHMLLWPPTGSPRVDELVEIMERAARAGSRIVIHDGDCKERTRHPHAIGSWCSLALCNHTYDRDAWKVPTLRWPYFAPVQEHIAPASPTWACPLFFAGTLGSGPVYAARSALLDGIRARGIAIRTPTAADGNTLAHTPTIAASAEAVLGFGRPDARGWTDTRVFQYPGAGGVLLHDDVQGWLEPWRHFVPYQSGNPDSVLDALERLSALPAVEKRQIRERAFAYVQLHHSSVARVQQVLESLNLSAA